MAAGTLRSEDMQRSVLDGDCAYYKPTIADYPSSAWRQTASSERRDRGCRR